MAGTVPYRAHEVPTHKHPGELAANCNQDQLTDDPIFILLTPEQTRAIAAFRGDEQVAQRVERAEYEAYASANHLIEPARCKIFRS